MVKYPLNGFCMVFRSILCNKTSFLVATLLRIWVVKYTLFILKWGCDCDIWVFWHAVYSTKSQKFISSISATYVCKSGYTFLPCHLNIVWLVDFWGFTGLLYMIIWLLFDQIGCAGGIISSCEVRTAHSNSQSESAHMKICMREYIILCWIYQQYSVCLLYIQSKQHICTYAGHL